MCSIDWGPGDLPKEEVGVSDCVLQRTLSVPQWHYSPVHTYRYTQAAKSQTDLAEVHPILKPNCRLKPQCLLSVQDVFHFYSWPHLQLLSLTYPVGENEALLCPMPFSQLYKKIHLLFFPQSVCLFLILFTCSFYLRRWNRKGWLCQRGCAEHWLSTARREHQDG